jgi:hypothetical protein
MTGGLAPVVQAFSTQLPGIVDKLTAAGAADEAQALQAFHDGLTQLVAGESSIVTAAIAQLEGALDRQRTAFFADLDARLGVTVNLHWIPPAKP